MMTNLNVGDKAPDFSLKDKDGKMHSLKEIRSGYSIVYFYPKDGTSGCTVEAVNFTKDLEKFKKLNTIIVGISGGDEKSKTKFCKDHHLKITLLSDPDFIICKKYNSYGKKSFMGREYMGIFRNTFVLDKNKKIIKIYEKVSPDAHSEELIKFIKNQEQ